MPAANSVGQIRPSSTFGSYQPQTASQQQALAWFQELSAAIRKKASDIATQQHPFAHGRIIFLSGPPGVGKTHLVEALVQSLHEDAQLVGKVFLFRGDFTMASINMLPDFDDCPVVVIDDLYAGHQSIEGVNSVDTRRLAKLLTMVYEERRLLVVTCNFQLMEGLAAQLAEVDGAGRVLSRLQELLAGSREWAIDGPDYRATLAASRTGEDFFDDL